MSKCEVEWKRLMGACYDPKHREYRFYGAKGAIVCKRWHNFDNFKLDVGEPPHDAYILARYNMNGVIEPSNTRWVEVEIERAFGVVYRGFRMTENEAAFYCDLTQDIFSKGKVRRMITAQQLFDEIMEIKAKHGDEWLKYVGPCLLADPNRGKNASKS